MGQTQFRSDDTDKWKYGFGNGAGGSTYATPANEGCSGTSGTTTLTLAATGGFTNGMLVLIHQSRGTGTGNWELNKVDSGGGTTSLVMKHSLKNTYADSGNNQAQIIELKQYKDLTPGAQTVPLWDGSKGGIFGWFDKGTTTINAALTLTGRGYNTGGNGGGSGTTDNAVKSLQGEGSLGAPSYLHAANGNGGGGSSGSGSDAGNGGGGGGNGAAGSNGGPGQSSAGIGGSAVGNVGLVSCSFGGEGGGGRGEKNGSGTGGSGGAGSGIAFIFAHNIVVTGSIPCNGSNGTTGGGSAGGGGGGAGGSVLLKCVVATLGTNLITATAGSGAAGGGGDGGNHTGGNGAVGRIHLDYSGSYTGTTSPTLDARLDTTIKGGDLSGFFLLI